MELVLGLVLLLALLIALWGWVRNKTRPTTATKEDEVELHDWEWAGNKLGCLIIAIVIAIVVGYPIFVLFIAPIWPD
ncbi:MAG: hypothetical protein QNI91_17700 [Arenicellales bacterium]|nr:hypothetical protein [Arenicellales bacterium]